MSSDLLEIILLTFKVSGTALLLSALIGIPLGAVMGLRRFIGRRWVVVLLYTGMGFPPVVIGLFVYLLLSRAGPLGQLNLPFIPELFTPGAMILAQTIIAFPLVAGFTMAAVMGVDPQLRQQVISLGATQRQAATTVLWEARIGVIVAIVAGFGSIISEVGAVMLVGGNIEGQHAGDDDRHRARDAQRQFRPGADVGHFIVGDHLPGKPGDAAPAREKHE